jgi:hypothetical protein
MSNCERYQENRRLGLIFNSPGTRYIPVNPYRDAAGASTTFTQQQLDMRRKAEILQYNKTSSNGKITKKQKFAGVVGRRKQYPSYYIRNIQNGTANLDEICPGDILVPTSTRRSDVPGPEIFLRYDPTVPLYNYNSNQFTYGIQNTNEQLQDKWFINYNTNVVDERVAMINIRPSIDTSPHTYTYTTSIALSIKGYVLQNNPSGTFTVRIPQDSLNLVVKYGGQIVPNVNPILAFSSGFVQDVSGYITNANSSFAGKIYVGNVTFSNIVLATPRGATYEIFVEYTPSRVITNIDNSTVSAIMNFTNGTSNSGLVFNTQASSDPIYTFSLTGR